MRRLAVLAPVVTLALTLTACATHTREQPSGETPGRFVKAPALHVTRLVTGLDHPWDVKPLGHGRLLISERDRARLSVWRHGHRRTVAFPSKRIWVSSETGLLGLAVDPRFHRNHRFYTCSGWVTANGGHDVRVNAWRLGARYRHARLVENLVHGFPTSSGRHGGCRLLIARSGALIVGTGDAAIGTNPQDTHSFGGKTLRLDRMTGRPWPGNRWVHAKNHTKRYLHTYGHRNVQGLAQRRDGTLWSAEHGPDRNDEINKLVNGGNYGWNPVPGYNESVPMTDHSLPGRQISARWSSGYPTIATSGSSFVYGTQWGRYAGTLAVAALKGSELVFLKFDHIGHFRWKAIPDALTHYGRLRAVTQLPGGSLLVTTDNGSGHDAVLRVRP